MNTVQLRVNDTDLQKYNLEIDREIEFSELVQKISLEYARKALMECNAIAKEVGLSEMTLEEINAEIKAVRDAKGNS